MTASGAAASGSETAAITATSAVARKQDVGAGQATIRGDRNDAYERATQRNQTAMPRPPRQGG
jgi:hypothetical protein